MSHGSPAPLQVEICWNGVAATVTVTGELDFTTASALSSRLLEVAAAHPQRLVLDLDQLAFADAASARALDHVCKLLEAECPVTLHPPRPSARTVSRRTGPMDG